MKERTDCVPQLKLSGTRKFCADSDALKTEEWKRRRLLRLEQVRQQSKDIASDIRRKVRLEKNSLVDNFQKRNEFAASRWKEQKLTALQNELTQTLSYVGSAHKQAECQVNVTEAKEQLKSQLIEAADRRGREAILRLRSDELTRKQVEESKKIHQQHVRSVEGARTAIVVSLPVPKSTVPVSRAAQLHKDETIAKDKLPGAKVKQWPSKVWSLSTPLGAIPENIEDLNCGKYDSVKLSVPSESKDNKLHYLHSNQSCKTIPSVSSDHQKIPDSSRSSTATSLESKKRSDSMPKRKDDPHGVELYDYSNGSHVQYIPPLAVSKSIPAGAVDGVEAAEACLIDSESKKNLTKELSAKRIKRGNEAIRRVQTRKDHMALLSDLAGLVRQQAALHSFVPVKPEDPNKVQEKLNEAVIGILKTSSGQKSEAEKSDPLRSGKAPVMKKVCLEADETLIDVCSQDQIDESARGPKEGKSSGFIVGERNIPEQSSSSIDISVDQRERDTSVRHMGENDSANETVSTSLGSDVPKLDLALWTSRSPGTSDTADRTLTAADQQDIASQDPEETLTPSEKPKESDSSRRSSLPCYNSSSGEKQSLSPTEKYPNKKGSDHGKTPNQIHLGSGDFVPPTEKHPKKKGSDPRRPSDQIHPGSGDFVTPPHRNPELHEVPPQQPRRRSKKESPSSSESTSYMSLPNKLLTAITEDLQSLVNLTRRRKGTDGRFYSNPLLSHYIHRLLDMSRQSVERLNVVTSEVPTPPSAVFRDSNDSSSRQSVSVPSTDVKSPRESENQSGLVTSRTDSTKTSGLSSSSIDNSDLINVMRQCHERISGLSQMIEKVRQESVVDSPLRRRSPSLHFDSTVYFSPPASVMPSPQMLPRNVDRSGRTIPTDESYDAVVTRLVSEIRQQLAREAEKPLQINLSPPGASAKHLNSSSSNDLSTIPEQDTSPLEWSRVQLSSEITDSSEGVEKEFRRMGLGWAEATLRKTKEAGTLDSNSSSEFLERSTLSLFGNYSHSTPIKTMEEQQNCT